MAATLATVGLVAMTATVYGYPRWGGYYLFAGVWTLVFLGLTPLILKAMLFDRRPLIGLVLIGFKVLWLVVMLAVGVQWSRGGADRLTLGTALVAGVASPLAVVVLRVLGGALRPQPDETKPTMEGKP